MLLSRCGDSGHGARAVATLRHRRRHRAERGQLIAWPAGRSDTEHAAGASGAAHQSAASPFGRTDERPFAHSDEPPRPLAGGQQRRPAAALAAFEGLSWLWQLLGQGAATREHWTELLRLAITSAERPVRAEMLNCIGQFAQAAGDLTIAHGCYQEALVAGRASQNAEGVVRSLDGLAGIAVVRGAFELARALQDEALTIRRRLGDQAGVARSLAILGWLILETRGSENAEALLEESLTIRVQLAQVASQRPDFHLAQAHGLTHLGWLALLTGQRELARAHLAEALALVEGSESHWAVVSLLALLGQPATSETPARTAAQLLIGVELLEAEPASPADGLADPFGYLAEARARLTPSALALVWGHLADGDGSMLVEQALCAADTGGGAGYTRASEQAGRHLLTPRELEVAQLIGKGYTNRRIADELVIGERTAETHARNIREKLGMSTRSQIAAWAAVRASTAS